jgi:large subunit ribosomal protein L22
MSDIRASHKHARITARKARLAADLVRGTPVNRALDLLRFSPQRSCRLLEKVIKSAVANANQGDERVDVNSLFISECRVDEGPLLRGGNRYRTAGKGRVRPIKKRTAHIHVGLSVQGAAVMPITQPDAPGAAKD